jgi:glycosyltransferase involved in cell wall biosynthesis
MLSIIIPARNAAAEIAKTLDEYIAFFTSKYGQDFEIIVVPNNCSDNTADVVKAYCDRYLVLKSKVIEESIGKGGAVIEGFGLAKGDIVSFVDADGATGPEELFKLVRQVSEYQQVVIGSRWLAGSRTLIKQSLIRRLVSRGFNLIIRLLFRLPFKDTQCGAKVFTRRALADVVRELETTKFAFDVELLYRLKKRGYKILEVPIVWENKRRSTLNLLEAIPEMFLAVVKVRLLESPFRRFVVAHHSNSGDEG